MIKMNDYILIKESDDQTIYLWDEFKNPITFKSKQAALQYMEVSSEEELNEKDITIELYKVFFDIKGNIKL